MYGDTAIIEYTKKYDNINIAKSEILIPQKIRETNKVNIDKKIMGSFEMAIQNITKFHQKQIPQNYGCRAGRRQSRHRHADVDLSRAG